ncbi:MAG: leucine-rich repeat domain-containing protein [Spirochaetaceae bacterium]|jgi:hypothetical protein|nr:leucine-rich repeat domain-containing protein [Spirochaetaceae bacterium]
MKNIHTVLVLAAAALLAACGSPAGGGDPGGGGDPAGGGGGESALILRINAGADKSFTIPTNNAWDYDWYIDWGDGTVEARETGTGAVNSGISHAFPGNTEYTISIRAQGLTGHGAFGFSATTDGSNTPANKEKLLKALGHIKENTSAAALPSAWAFCFYGCSNLNEVSANLLPAVPKGTSDIFSGMFYNCISLASLPAGFRLPEVPNGTSNIFAAMFYNCISLASLPAGFRLPAVPKGTSDIFYGMFLDCSSLASLPAGFSLPAVPNGTSGIFSSMFSGCSSLASLPAGFSLPAVPKGTSGIFYGMFLDCSSLESLPAGFSLPAVPNGTSNIFYDMFLGCSSLASLPAGFSLPAVPKGTSDIFSAMFFGCSSLASLPAGFSLPAVPNGTSHIFSYMFSSCSSLEADITDLISKPLMDAARLNGHSYNMYATFYLCAKLTGFGNTAITTGFAGATPSNDKNTFYGCTGLSDYPDIPVNWK